VNSGSDRPPIDRPPIDRAAIITIVLASLFAAVIGVAVGFITTFTHRGLAPWGLVAGLVIVAALVLGFRLVFSSRIIGAAAAIGVVGATALLMLPGAGGTVLVLDDPIGYAWAIGPTVLSTVALLWPTPTSRRNRGADRLRMDP
jgi:N-acetyl-1-D-myo-inositol-2-amino-2-deoxy-alpha-D-glucopyranoside deacetylase